MTRHRAVGLVATAIAVVLGVFVLAGAARPASGTPAAERRTAQSDDAGVEMSIEASYGNWIGSNRAYPVFVTLTAEQLVRGTIHLDLNTADGPVTLQREVEVSGGTTERYGFVAPPTVATGFHELAVQLRGVTGEQIVEQAHEMTGANDHELVGMLSDVAARYAAPENWSLLAVERTGVARPLPVAPEALELGTLALDPLDQIVTTAAELAELPDDHRTAILSWVDAGGELLVVGDLAAAETSLPEAWVPPSAGGSARAGLGAVRSVGENWLAGLAPSPTRTAAEETTLADTLMPGGSVELPLARRARANLSPAGGLGLLLVVYVVVAGPLVFLVTRAMRRRQLVWVALPVLALGSTGVVAAGGDGLRSDVGSAHVTVYETGPAGTRATTWSLLASTAVGGEATVAAQLPTGWVASPFLSQVDMMETGGSGRVRTTQGPEGATAQLTAAAGAYGVLETQGPAAGMDEALVVNARSASDGEVVGSVRNQLDVPLDHVVAVVGRVGIAEVGTLAPGEEREFTIAGVTEFQWAEPPEAHVLPRAPWSGGPDPDLPVARNVIVLPDAGVAGGDPAPPPLPPPVVLEPPPGAADRGDRGDQDGGDDEDDDDSGSVIRDAWFETVWRTGWNFRPIGQVVAVGWTDELAAPLEPGDGTAGTTDALSAIVARTTVVPAGDRLTDAAVVRSYLRGPGDEMFRLAGRNPERTIDESFAERDQEILGILYGFEVPATVGERPVDPARLTLGLPDRFDAAEVWTPTGWVPLQVPTPGDGQLAVAVPPEALIAGRVFVRAAVPFGSTQPGQELVLYEREEAAP